MEETYRLVRRGIVLVLVTITWCILIPGFAASWENVLLDRDVRLHVANRAELKVLRDFEAESTEIAARAHNVDRHLAQAFASGSTARGLGELIQLREYYHHRETDRRPNITISGFIGNFATYVWLVVYLALGCLTILWPPPQKVKLREGKIWALALLTFIIFNWPNWYRNSALGQQGRQVFSYVHLDIAPISFFLQELRILVMFVLWSILWHLWMREYATSRDEVRQWHRTSNHSSLAMRMLRVQDSVRQWQVTSTLLAMAFLPWTYFFWSSVARRGDARYWISAIFWHVSWIVSWILISAPTQTLLREWRREKLLALDALTRSDATHRDADRAYSFLSPLDPVPQQTALISVIASGISLLLPLVEFIK
jgi:hypothetical protein